MTVQLSYRVLRVYVPFTAFNFNEEMNSFKGMGVLNVTVDKKSSRVISVDVHDSLCSFKHTLSWNEWLSSQGGSTAPSLPCSCPCTNLSFVPA